MTEALRDPFALPWTNRRYLDAVLDHVVLFDGAMGTELQKYPLTAEDFGGVATEGLMEMLVLHRPAWVQAVHRAYLEAGAEVIETDTFRANRITFADFGLESRVVEINRRAARLAREVADAVAAETGVPRYVAGSMGPSGKLPSLDDPDLSDIPFAELVAVFAEQAQGLIEGGVDLLLLETQQDLLELKAAVLGIWETFHRMGVRLPVQAQVTLDGGGHMLTGPDIDVAVVTLAALPVDLIGMNCSTGPDEMRPSVRRLVSLSNRPASVLPNAGMPRNVGGKAVYDLAPETFAEAMTEFARWGVRVVGGCCGTEPQHIRRLRDRLVEAGLRPLDGAGRPLPTPPPSAWGTVALPYAASNMRIVSLHQEPPPLLVGERINTQGSRRARRLVLARDYEALLALAEQQMEYGAHLLDLCVALTERSDEAETMQHVAKLLALNAAAPLMFDTTDLPTMEAALTTCPGRPVINSVHLEGGEARARRILEMVRRYGAAIVALTIDEQGMAKTAERKVAVARRLYRLAVEEMGLPPHALIFDALTFTLSTGDPALADSARATLEGIRRIKAAFPGVLTNLGVSNVSYGFSPPARRVLNSVFLYHAVQAGLDMAIVNPAQITPYPEIPAEERELAEALLFNRHAEALSDFIHHFEGVSAAREEAAQEEAGTPSERLYRAIVHRRRQGVEALVEAAVAERGALAVLNEVLLPAMKEVGDRFGAGELILPFVLKSAEVMKAAVARLEAYLERDETTTKGVVVLATVFGDVHDIGKNLVKTIFANNGYTVVDLGKQVPARRIVEAVAEHGADALGLSALLVSTSRQMQVVVDELRRRGMAVPVLIGGAAINRAFAERIARDEAGTPYAGGVFYCKDAFEGLHILDGLAEGRADVPSPSLPAREPVAKAAETTESACPTCRVVVPTVRPVPPDARPRPPAWGYWRIDPIPLDALWPLLDRKSLYRVGWGARGARGERWEAIAAEFDARLAAMWREAADYLHPRGLYGYFPAQSQGNDLIVYDPADPAARREIARFTFPRQSKGRRLCLADYFAPVEEPQVDVVVFQVVTAGEGATVRFAELEAAGAYSEAYFVHGLAAAVAEAAAEWLHGRIRRELGLPPDRGKRYSWGYPACPDLEQHRILFRLLPVEAELGVHLSPAAQLVPEYSTAAIVVHHPQASYFVVR